MSDLSKFFQPRSIAFVGATSDERKLGGRRFRSLVDGGFKGKIYAVHPSAKVVRGIPSYRTLLEIPSPVDLAVIVVPSDTVQSTIHDCATLGIPAIMLISAGFGEVDSEGRRIELSMVNEIRSTGGRLIGPNCAGLFSHAARINLGGATVPGGSVALVSQSGNLLLDFNLRALDTGLGFSRQVAIGNAADLDGVDLIADCLDDPSTSVVLAYIEGLAEGRGRALFELAQNHPANKPIVLLKPGRSDAGRHAAITHTGSLSGEERITDGALRQAGILRALGIAEAWEMTEALCRCPPLRGDRVAIVSDGGGHATVLADSLGLAGFKVPRFQPGIQQALAEFLPSRAAIANPIDFAGVVESDPKVLPQAVNVCLRTSDVDAVIVAGHFGGYHRVGTPELEKQEIEAACSIARLAKNNNRPILFQSIHADSPTKSLEILRQAGIPVSRSPEYAAIALAALRDAPTRPSHRGAKYTDKLFTKVSRNRAMAILSSASQEGVLTEPEARTLLHEANFDVPKFILVKDADEAIANCNFQGWSSVAMKLIAPGIIHRSQVGGVLLNLKGEAAIRSAIRTLLSRCPEASRPKAQLLLTQMIEPGLEIICGGLRDRQFGPVVMVGFGGTMVEVVDNVIFRLAPLDKDDAKLMIANILTPALLNGFHGASLIHQNALTDIIVKLGSLMTELPTLQTMELNPVIMSSGSPQIADARATFINE